jgi:hypothetical protein
VVHYAEICVTSLKHVLAIGAPNVAAEKWDDEWTADQKESLRLARSPSKVGSMSQMTGHQALLDAYDRVFKTHLLDESGCFKFNTQNRTARRATWRSYVSALYDETFSYNKGLAHGKRPVANMADRIAAVLHWPPYEDAPPPPLFGPSALDAIIKWAEQHAAGVREVSRAVCYNEIESHA